MDHVAGRVLRCPLGRPTRSLQSCDFGRTLFQGLREAPPSKTALCDVASKERISYKSFIDKAEITARHLLRNGCRKGDVIALFAPNSIDWLVVVAASFRIGLVPAGINYVLQPEEVCRQLILSGASFLFTCCGQHLETALKSLSGTKVHTLFYIGDDCVTETGKGEKGYGDIFWQHETSNANGNRKITGDNREIIRGLENGSNGCEHGNRIGSEHDNHIRGEYETEIEIRQECGFGCEKENGIGKRHENRIGKGYKNGIEKSYTNGIGKEQQENEIGKECRNGFGKQHENGIRKEHTDGVKIERKNGIGKGLKSGIGIVKLHQNKCKISKRHDDLATVGNGNRRDDTWMCVPLIDTTVVFCQPVLPEFDELELKPQDIAMVMLTSGTTGLPKAILLTHLNLQAQFIIASDERVMKVSDGQVVCAPFSHLGGGVMTLFALSLGYTTYITTSFELEPYLRTLSENKTKSIAIVPAIALSLANAREDINYDLSSLRQILCGTARLSSQVEQQLSSRFPGSSVRQGYGLTETTAICICVPRNLEPSFARSKSGSIGVPMYNVEIKVVDCQSGVILGPMQNGEILIRSPLVMQGYRVCNDVITSGPIDDEGWLHSGDMGCYDDDGYLWFADRITDLMKCASFQVSPSELESVLLTHSDVADAAVFALHNGTSGDDLPAAWVVRKQGGRVTEEELDSHVSNLLASYKRLRGGIRFVESIPRTSNGKILRLKIQQLASALSTLT